MPKPEYQDNLPVIGIPDRSVVKPIPDSPFGVGRPEDSWEMVLHEHHAKRAGLHFDLRLGDPATGDGHSWAIRKWPNPGEKVLAVQQPTHTIGYFDFKGKIESGYGAGEVDIADRGKAEIIEASPQKLKFGLYKGSGPQEYTLVHTGEKNWLLINSTPSRTSLPEVPKGKPDYKDVKPADLPLDVPGQVMTAKIDGGHSVFVLNPGKPVRAFSHRTSKRNPTGLIEHSHKLPELYNTKSPADLGKTILRGEIWAQDKKGKEPLPAATVGGMLNADVWKSRDEQARTGTLRAAIFDVLTYKGKDVSGLPYAEKIQMLEDVRAKVPGFELPDMALTPGQKRELFERISRGAHPQTKEGVVMQDLLTSAKPLKVKLKHASDVIITGFFPGEGKYKGRGVGGFYYAHEDNPTKTVGKVGTGLSDALREDMHRNSQNYVGKVAKVEGTEIYEKDGKKGAIQKPAFKEFHIDKDYSEDFTLSPEEMDDLAKKIRRRLS